MYELSKVSEELDHWVDSLLDEVKHIDEGGDYLEHYGKGHDDNPPGRGSGRYPYGSGERPFQRDPAHRKLAGSSGNIVRRPKTGGLFSMFRKSNSESSNTEDKEAAAKSTADEIIRIAREHGGYGRLPIYLDLKAVKELAEKDSIKQAREKMRLNDSEYPKYMAEYEHYAKMAAHVDWELNKGIYERSTMTVKDNENWFLYDDGDQGDYNSFVCYLIDRCGLDAHRIQNYGIEAQDAHQAYMETISIWANDYLGKYANIVPSNNKGYYFSVSDILRDAVDEYYDKQENASYFGWYKAELSKFGEERFAEAKAAIDKFNEENKSSGSKNPVEANNDGEHRPAAPRGSGLKTGILDRLRKNRTEATKELAKTAEAKEQERQIKEAQAKAEALKQKRLAALAKAREARKANIDKAAAEREAEEARQKRIKEAIDSGDPTRIAAIMTQLSNQEQKDAITRISQTSEINKLAAQQRKAVADAEAARLAAQKAIEEANRPRTKAEIREQKFNEAMAKVSKAAEKADKIRENGEKFIKFYNLAAAVNNAVNDKLKLPKIDLGGGDKKKDDKNKDEQKKDDKNKSDQKKDKQQQNSGGGGGDTYNTNDSFNTYNTFNNYQWTAFTDAFYNAYQSQPNRQNWEFYQEQGNQLLEDFSKRKK